MRKTLALIVFFAAPALAQAGPSAPCAIERAAAAGQYVWLLCDGDSLYSSADAGASWQPRPLPSDAGKLRAIAFLDARRGFVAGNGGSLFATENGGETWKRVAVPAQENLTSIWFTGELGWITGWNGAILHSGDGGRTWVRQRSGVLQGLESIYFADEKHGWAVGWVGTVLHTSDGGQTWHLAPTGSFWALNSVYFRDAKSGWAVGFDGQILRSRDGGLTWEAQESPTRAWLRSVFFDSDGRGWIAAQEDLLVSDDGGESWKRHSVDGRFMHQVLPVRDSVWAIGRYNILEQDGRKAAFRSVGRLSAAVPPEL